MYAYDLNWKMDHIYWLFPWKDLDIYIPKMKWVDCINKDPVPLSVFIARCWISTSSKLHFWCLFIKVIVFYIIKRILSLVYSFSLGVFSFNFSLLFLHIFERAIHLYVFVIFVYCTSYVYCTGFINSTRSLILPFFFTSYARYIHIYHYILLVLIQ